MNPKTVSSKPKVAVTKAGPSKPLIDVHDLKAPHRNKVLPAMIAVFALVLAIVVAIRLNRNAEPSRLESNAASSSTIISGSSEVPTFSMTVNGQEVALETQMKAAPTLSGQPLSKISASQISNVTRQGSNWLVTFIDGSQSILNESLMKQLPGEVHFQAEYRREQ